MCVSECAGVGKLHLCVMCFVYLCVHSSCVQLVCICALLVHVAESLLIAPCGLIFHNLLWWLYVAPDCANKCGIVGSIFLFFCPAVVQIL